MPPKGKALGIFSMEVLGSTSYYTNSLYDRNCYQRDLHADCVTSVHLPMVCFRAWESQVFAPRLDECIVCMYHRLSNASWRRKSVNKYHSIWKKTLWRSANNHQHKSLPAFICQQNATPVLQHNLKRKGVQPLWDNHSYCQAGAPCQCYTLRRKWVRTTNDPPGQLLVPACCIKCKPAVQTVWFMMALTFDKKPLEEDWMASIFKFMHRFAVYKYVISIYIIWNLKQEMTSMENFWHLRPSANSHRKLAFHSILNQNISLSPSQSP